jgi:3-dehydroquinate synthetase
MVAGTARDSAPRSIDVLDYQVIVGGGMIDALGAVCQRVAPAHRYAIISDEQVARHWLTPAVTAISNAIPRSAIRSTTVPAGEASKSRERWSVMTGCCRRAQVAMR